MKFGGKFFGDVCGAQFGLVGEMEDDSGLDWNYVYFQACRIHLVAAPEIMPWSGPGHGGKVQRPLQSHAVPSINLYPPD